LARPSDFHAADGLSSCRVFGERSPEYFADIPTRGRGASFEPLRAKTKGQRVVELQKDLTR
jgi:hypothetical protein